ncbi:unnamed protein product [Toxocara canis]|uniref:Reverse transcriptase domain-containing protein n=1 Tax=Toxocara canis TaxID=6265 RepID=A0A183V209_TOXCA|nr:unnamed protein product [Toxocara canis]
MNTTETAKIPSIEIKDSEALLEAKEFDLGKGCWKKPHLLIGVDQCFRLMTSQEIEKLPSGFLLIQSVVGPTIMGKGAVVSREANSRTKYSRAIVVTGIEHDVERLWRLEELEIWSPNKQEEGDENALKQFYKTIEKKECGRHSAHNEIIEQQLQQGIIQKARNPADGPLELQEPGREACRFLWLRNPDDPNIEVDRNLQTYRFFRVPFGVVSSPFLLAAVLKTHMKGCTEEKAIDKNLTCLLGRMNRSGRIVEPCEGIDWVTAKAAKGLPVRTPSQSQVGFGVSLGYNQAGGTRVGSRYGPSVWGSSVNWTRQFSSTALYQIAIFQGFLPFSSQVLLWRTKTACWDRFKSCDF